MENQADKTESPSVLTYVVGAVIVLAVVGGAWYFRTMTSTAPSLSPLGNIMEEQTVQELPPAPTPTPGPITGLGCDYQYFNPKNGFAEYYLSAAGGDLATAQSVACEFKAMVNNVEVGRANAVSTLTAAPLRGGSTFTCTTAAVPLEPNVKTIVEVTLTDDINNIATCSGEFTYPSP